MKRRQQSLEQEQSESSKNGCFSHSSGARTTGGLSFQTEDLNYDIFEYPYHGSVTESPSSSNAYSSDAPQKRNETFESRRQRSFRGGLRNTGITNKMRGMQYASNIGMGMRNAPYIKALDAEIEQVRHEIDKCEKKLEYLKNNDFLGKLRMAGHVARNCSLKRKELLLYIGQQSPVMKAISALDMEFDQLYMEVKGSSDKIIEHMDSSQHFQDISILVLDFLYGYWKLQEANKTSSLEEYLTIIRKAIKDLETSQEHKKAKPMKLDVQYKIAMVDFNSWKEKYYEAMKNTDAKYKAVIDVLNKAAEYFQGFEECGLRAQPQLSLPAVKAHNLFVACKAEGTLQKKEDIINTALTSCIQEIGSRLELVALLDTIYLVVEARLDIPDFSLPVMEYLQEKKNIDPSLVYYILCSVINELIDFHERNEIYMNLTPANIRLGAKIKLVPKESAERGEPALPFIFMAPEAVKKISKANLAAAEKSLQNIPAEEGDTEQKMDTENNEDGIEKCGAKQSELRAESNTKEAYESMEEEQLDFSEMPDEEELYFVEVESKETGNEADTNGAKKERVTEPSTMAQEVGGALGASVTKEEDESITVAADIYSFGQLVLWLAYRGGEFKYETWKDSKGRDAIRSVISQNPHLRPAASEVRHKLLPLIFDKIWGPNKHGNWFCGEKHNPAAGEEVRKDILIQNIPVDD